MEVQTRGPQNSKAPKPLAVGAETDAMCGKCKKLTRHIIIAMLSGKPSRVECKVCAATHAFRSGKSAPRGRAAVPAAPVLTAEEIWTQAMRRADGISIRYAMSGHYEVGQRVTHATFGDGVVVGLPSPTVCEVVFNTGTKKLLMGR